MAQEDFRPTPEHDGQVAQLIELPPTSLEMRRAVIMARIGRLGDDGLDLIEGLLGVLERQGRPGVLCHVDFEQGPQGTLIHGPQQWKGLVEPR